MTTLTKSLFASLSKLSEIADTHFQTVDKKLWYQLAIIAVTALVDIADSLAHMATARD